MARVQLDGVAAVDLQGDESIIFANHPNVSLGTGFKVQGNVNIVLTNKRLIVVSNKDGNQLFSSNYGDIKDVKSEDAKVESNVTYYLHVTPKDGKKLSFSFYAAKGAAGGCGCMKGCLGTFLSPGFIIHVIVRMLTFGVVKTKYKNSLYDGAKQAGKADADAASSAAASFTRPDSWGSVPSGWEGINQLTLEAMKIPSLQRAARRDIVCLMIQKAKGLA